MVLSTILYVKSWYTLFLFSFLGYIDKIGIAYEAQTIATGFGMHIAQPIMRDQLEKTPHLTEQDAVRLLDRCLKVLFYRDARSFNKVPYKMTDAVS